MIEAKPLTLDDLHARAQARIAELEEGESLTSLDEALIELGVSASVCALDRAVIEAAIKKASAAGASAEQLQEVISLVSGVGVHSLMVTAPAILSINREGASGPLPPLSKAQQALWDRYVGEDPFWTGFEHELPGFLDAMLRLSSDQFAAFFEYCAVPWKSGTVRAKTKELVAMACDAMPAHRFLPGFNLHLGNAIALGVGRKAILRALEIAAAVPPHCGTR